MGDFPIERQDLLAYMVDVLGYSESDDDLDALSINELAYMLTADELAECYTFTNR